MQLIFEDCENMAISSLLKRYLNDSVCFTGGNGNLCEEIERAIVRQDQPIVVYIDVVPDNPEIIDKYIDLRAAYQSEDVHIVAIPCIEYCALCVIEKCILLRGREECDAVIMGVINKNLSDKEINFYRSYKSWNSFERFCKFALSQQVMQCVQNVNVEGGYGVRGKFYMEDCDCDERYTRNCKEKHTLQNKYCMLVEALGVFPNEMYSSAVEKSGQDSSQNINTLYEQLYRLVGYRRFLNFMW